MLQVAALEIIHSEFHFTLTQSKYRLEAREGGLGKHCPQPYTEIGKHAPGLQGD